MSAKIEITKVKNGHMDTILYVTNNGSSKLTPGYISARLIYSGGAVEKRNIFVPELDCGEMLRVETRIGLVPNSIFTSSSQCVALELNDFQSHLNEERYLIDKTIKFKSWLIFAKLVIL